MVNQCPFLFNPMSQNTNNTANPLFTKAMGEKVTPQDEQLINDFTYSNPDIFVQKYGQKTYDALSKEANVINPYIDSVSSNRSAGEFTADMARNFLSGALSGTLSTGSFISGLAGLDGVSKTLARGSEAVSEGISKRNSMASQASDQAYAYRQYAMSNRLDREYKDDIARGVDEKTAKTNRETKAALGTIGNAWTSNKFADIASSGLGSMLPSYLLMGAGGLAVKGASAVAPKLMTKANDLYKANKVAKLAGDHLPWMASTGIQEGGDAYAQTLNDSLDKSIEELREFSPKFTERVHEKMLEGKTRSEAEQEVKQELAQAAAMQAGYRTGATASVANIFTNKLARPFEKTGSTAFRRLGEGLTEPIEEGISEGAGQYFGNEATKEYINKNQDLYEGVGQSVGEGAVGGLGMVGTKTATDIVPLTKETFQGAKATVNGALNAKESLSDKVTEITTSSNRVIAENIYRAQRNQASIPGSGDNSRTMKDVVSDLGTTYASMNPKDENGKSVPLDPVKAVDTVSNLMKDMDIVNQTEDTNQEVQEAKKDTSNALYGMSHRIYLDLQRQVERQRMHYNPNKPLTQEQMDLEGAYFTVGKALNKRAVEQGVDRLPTYVQEALRNGNFSSDSVGSSITSYLGQTSNNRSSNTKQNTQQSNNASNTSSNSHIRNEPVNTKSAFADYFSEPKNTETTDNTSNSAQTNNVDGSATPSVNENIGTTTSSTPNETITSTVNTSNQDTDTTSIADKKPTAPSTPSATPTSTSSTSTAPSTNVSSGSSVKDPAVNNDQQQSKKTAPKSKGKLFKSLKDAPKPATILEESTEEEAKFEEDVPVNLDESTDTVYFKTPDGKIYKVQDKNLALAVKSARTQEQVTEIINHINKLIYAHEYSKQIKSFTLEDASGKKHTLHVSPDNLLSFNGSKPEKLPSDVADTLRDPDKSEEEKIDALTGYLESIFTLRAEQELSPHKLQESNYYLDEYGNVSELSSNEIKEEFNNMYPELEGKVIPVKRPMYLAIDKGSPLDHFCNLLKSPIDFANLWLSNKQSNVRSFLQKLYGVDRSSHLEAPREGVLKDYANNLAEQILDALSRDGTIYKTFFNVRNNQNASSAFKVNDKMPEAFKKFFFDTNMEGGDPLPKQNLLEISFLVAVNTLAELAAMPHPLEREELLRHGVNPDGVTTEFMELASKNLMEEMVVSNLKRTLMRYMAVTEHNATTEKEIDEIFGTWAVTILSQMVKTNLLEMQETTVKPVVDVDIQTDTKETIEEKRNRTLNIKFLGIPQNSEYLKKLFRPSARIVTEILNPNYRNVFSLDPVKVPETVHNTDTPLTIEQKEILELENKAEWQFNVPFLNMIADIGGVIGLRKIFGSFYANSLPSGTVDAYDPNVADPAQTNERNYLQIKGRTTTDELGIDYLTSMLLTQGNLRLSDIVFHVANNFIRNGRQMQLGAAIPQANKLLRVIARKKYDSQLDLTNDEHRKSWLVCIANNLGVKTDAKGFNKYSKDAQKLLDAISEQYDKYENVRKAIDSLMNQDTNRVAWRLIDPENSASQTNLQDQQKRAKYYKDMFGALNKALEGTPFKIDSIYSLNAMVELFRYAKAKKESKSNPNTLKKFQSEITIEIDGKNSGPAQIIAQFAKSVNSMSATTVTNMAKTGNYLGVEGSTQEMSEKGSPLSKLYGGIDGDMHNEVAKKQLSNKIRAKIEGYISDLYGDKAYKKEPAKNALKALTRMFDLFVNLGWADHNPISFKDDKYFIEDFNFEREMSKILTTIIPYGSEVKGTTSNLLGLINDWFVDHITKSIMDLHVTGKDPEKSENYKKLESAFSALQELFHYQRVTDPSGDNPRIVYQDKIAPLHTLTTAWSSNLKAGLSYVMDPTSYWTGSRNDFTNVSPKDREYKLQHDLRKFTITDQGMQTLLPVFMELFGESAQNAVVDTIGMDGMRASKISAVISEILTMVARAAEDEFLGENSWQNKTYQERYEFNQNVLAKISPIYRLATGNLVSVGKQRVVVDRDHASYTDPDTGIATNSTRTMIDSSGVSGSPLMVQASGDGNIAMLAIKKAAELGIPFVNVFDGFYFGILQTKEGAILANECVAEMLKNNPITIMRHRLYEVENFLQQYFNIKPEKGRTALDTVLENIALGKSIDGSRALKRSYIFNSGLLLKSLSSIMYVKTPEDREKAKKQSTKTPGVLSHQTDKDRVADDLVKEVRALRSLLKAMSEIEKAHTDAMATLPKTIHHMSGSEYVYTEGKPFTVQEAQAFLDKVNSHRKDKIENWGAFIAMYLNRMTRQLLTERGKIDDDAVQYVLGSDNVSGPYAELDDQSYMEFLTELSGRSPKEVPSPKKEVKISSKREVSPKEVEELFSNIAKDSTIPAFFKTLYRKLKEALPNNVKVIMTNDLAMIDPSLSDKTNGSNRYLGIYKVINGEPTIIIKSKDKDLSLKDPAVQRTVLHEMIHATMSSTILAYYNGGKNKLTVRQKNALRNLESLVDSLMNQEEWDSTAPREVQDLRKKLIEASERAGKDNKAVLLDEATAYLLTKASLIESFSSYRLKDSTAHQNRLKDLLFRFAKGAKRLLKEVLGIKPGTAFEKVIDKVLNIHEHDMFKKSDFLYMYGMNTLAVMDDITKGHRGKPTNKNTKITRAMVDDIAISGDLYKNTEATETNDILREVALRDTTQKIATSAKKKVNRSETIDKVKEKFKTFANKLVDLEEAIYGDYQNRLSSIDTFLRKDAIDPKYRIEMNEMLNKIKQKIRSGSMDLDEKDFSQKEINTFNNIKGVLTGRESLVKELRDSLPDTYDKNSLESAIVLSLIEKDPILRTAVADIKLGSYKRSPMTLKERLQSFVDSKIIKDDSRESSVEGLSTKVKDDVKKRTDDYSIKEPLISIDKLFKVANSTLYKVITFPFKLFNSDKAKEAEKLLNVANKSPIFGFNFMNEGLRALTTKFKKRAIADTLKEIYGTSTSMTPLAHLLKEVKGKLDKNRSDKLDSFPEFLQGLFMTKKPTAEDRHMFSRTLGRTNIHTLDPALVKDLFTGKKSINEEISIVEERLNAKSSDAEAYIRKAKQLSNYFTGNRKSGHNLLTNAFAIAHLWGEPEAIKDTVPADIIEDIDKLITLYSLQNLSSKDMKSMSEFFTKDPEAMESILNTIRNIHLKEETRLELMEGSDLYKSNHFAGSIPLGSTDKGHFAYVPASKVNQYKKYGYKDLGVYEGSDLDTEPIHRMYVDLSLEREYQENILQGIHLTGFGFNTSFLTREEANGTKIHGKDAFNHILDKFEDETSDNGVIPIYSNEGEVVGFERAVDPRDREYIEKDSDLFRGLAQYDSHQERESLRDLINSAAIDICAEQYKNAPESIKKNYIDLFESDDPVIKEGLKRLPQSTIKLAKERMNGHFWVLADEIDLLLGHRKMSITESWNGNFNFMPQVLQKGFVKAMEAILGETALYKVGIAERLLFVANNYAKETIIIRSMIVPFVNALANISMMYFALGIPISKIIQFSTECVKYTKQYDKLKAMKDRLEFKLSAENDPQKRKEIRLRLEKVDNRIKALPVYDMINEGEYSTISAEGALFNEPDVVKAKLVETFEDVMNKPFKPSDRTKKIYSNVFINKGSTVYTYLANTVNMTDWVAKYAAVRYLTEGDNSKGKKRISFERARMIADTLFVDFDQPVGREREYLDRTAMTWFLTYKLRMIPAMFFTMIANPSRTILGGILGSMLPSGLQIGTPIIENAISKTVTGDIFYSLGFQNILRSLTMNPVISLAF